MIRGVERRAAQRGVALAMVVWFIAGMSLLVAGLVYQARLDLRLAQLHSSRAKVAAAGDGAIQLALAAATEQDAGGGRPPSSMTFRLGELQARVRLVPVNGLIDLQRAPPDLLRYLLEEAGVADTVEAETLADNVVKWRQNLTGGGGRLNVPEQLLRVPGFDRLKIEALRDWVAAGAGGGVFNPAQAPENVLRVFARKDPRKAAAIAGGREANGKTGTMGKGNGRDGAAYSGDYRVDALISLGGRQWLRRRWVSFSSTPHSALPWHFTRTEPPRVVGGG